MVPMEGLLVEEENRGQAIVLRKPCESGIFGWNVGNGYFCGKIRNNMAETGMHDMESATKCGKMIKVKSLKSSDEVRQERWREKQASRARALQARREMLLQAVEQAVTLPEPVVQIPREMEEVVPEVAPTRTNGWVQGKVEKLNEQVRNVLGSVTSLFEKARIMVLETD